MSQRLSPLPPPPENSSGTQNQQFTPTAPAPSTHSTKLSGTKNMFPSSRDPTARSQTSSDSTTSKRCRVSVSTVAALGLCLCFCVTTTITITILSRMSTENAQWIARSTSDVIATSCVTQLTAELSFATDAADVLQFELLKRERVLLPTDDDAMRKATTPEAVGFHFFDRDFRKRVNESSDNNESIELFNSFAEYDTKETESTTTTAAASIETDEFATSSLVGSWYSRWHTTALTYGRVRHTSLLSQVTFAFADGNFVACKVNSTADTEVHCISTEVEVTDEEGRTNFVIDDDNETLRPVMLNMYSRINGTEVFDETDYIVDIDLRNQVWYREITDEGSLEAATTRAPAPGELSPPPPQRSTPQPFQKSWTSLHFTPQSHQATLVLSFSLINSTGTFLGVGAFEVRVAELNAFIKSIRPTPSTELVLLDHHQKVISATTSTQKHCFTTRRVPSEYRLTASDVENRCAFSSFDIEDFNWDRGAQEMDSSNEASIDGDEVSEADETKDLYCQMSMKQLGLPYLTDLIKNHPEMLPTTNEHNYAHYFVSTYGTQYASSKSIEVVGTRRLSLNGKAVWTSVATDALSEWTIIIFVPEEDLLGELRNATIMMIIIGCISTVVLSVLSFLLLNGVMRPVLAIAKKMENASYLSLDLDRIDEEDDEGFTVLGHDSEAEPNKLGLPKPKKTGTPKLSFLTDVAILQRAYWTMVNEIRTLRSYVPSHVCDEIVTVSAAKKKNLNSDLGDLFQRNRSEKKNYYEVEGGHHVCGADQSMILSTSAFPDEAGKHHTANKFPIIRVPSNKKIQKNGSAFMFEDELDQEIGATGVITSPVAKEKARDNFCQAIMDIHNQSLQRSISPQVKRTASKYRKLDPALEADRNLGMGLQLFTTDHDGRLQYEESISPMLSLCSAQNTNSGLLNFPAIAERGLNTNEKKPNNNGGQTIDDGVSIVGPSEIAATLARRVHVSAGHHPLVDRDISVAVVNIVAFHSFAMNTECSSDVLRHHEAAVAFIQSVATRCGGVLDTFNGDKFWVSFNATSKCDSNAIAAVCFALEVSRGMNNLQNQNTKMCNSDDAVPVALRVDTSQQIMGGVHRLLSELDGVTIGIATGRALVGPMGTRTMKRHSIIGNVICEAAALERQASRYPDSPVIIAGDMIPIIEGYFKYLLIDACALPGSCGKRRRIASIKGIMCANGCNASLLRGVNLANYTINTNKNNNNNNKNAIFSAPSTMDSISVSLSSNSTQSSHIADKRPSHNLPSINPYKSTNDFFNAFLEGRLDDCVGLMRELDAAAGASQTYWSMVKKKEEESEQKRRERLKMRPSLHCDNSSSQMLPSSCSITAPMVDNNLPFEEETSIIVPPTSLFQPQECENIAIMLQFVWSLLAQQPPVDGRKYQSPFGASYA